MVGVAVEEDLEDIGMNNRKLVLKLEGYCEAAWTRTMGEGWKIKSADQCVEWITRIDTEEELNSMDLII